MWRSGDLPLELDPSHVVRRHRTLPLPARPTTIRCGHEDRLSMPVQSEEVQGSLFGPPEEPERQTALPLAGTDASKPGDDQTLIADAVMRPRRPAKQNDSNPAEDGADGGADEPKAPTTAGAAVEAPGDDTRGDHRPRWHHHALPERSALTPMLRHYVELKAAHPERLLLYRLGDFYESFFEDAIEVSRLLELTLTGKDGGKGIGRVPMAGLPHHAADRYCGELIRRGFSVALCDQLETTPSKGNLLRRGITRVLTPGTVIEEGMLSAKRNNWLCALMLQGSHWGLAIADVSTGEFLVNQQQGSAMLNQALLQLNAAELVLPVEPGTDPGRRPTWCPQALQITPSPRSPFEAPQARALLRQRFNLRHLEGLGFAELPLAERAAGGLLAYLAETQPNPDEEGNGAPPGGMTIPLERPRVIHSVEHLMLDAQTRRNLELTRTQRDGVFQGSLLWAIDRTLTAMGGRCLRRWLESPLRKLEPIRDRQQAIGELVDQRSRRIALRRLLRPMGDLERLAGRAGAGSASARDLIALADGLERLPKLAGYVADCQSPTLVALQEPDPELSTLADSIRSTLMPEPSLSLTEGGLILDGVDPLLDGLRNRLDDQTAWLRQQERAERLASGNSNLRLQYHRTFGYFLAVSRARAQAVPAHWVRRQTLANEERFVTPDLKAREGTILQLRTRAAQREYELVLNLRAQVGAQAEPIRDAARRVAALDALTGLAEVAATGGYCCPEVTEGRGLEIVSGRHPVVEQLLVEEHFTENDVHLGEGTDLVILTGPNASGKSCYLRQTGILQLMAQMGSWIPAQRARLGTADRLFTRVGAVDDLTGGQSTFMVEMAETANILHNATDRSLVLLDEIGRGTATFDGLSIAWAVAEYLAGSLRARAIFATHYHELNALAGKQANVATFQVLVEETGEELLFPHRVAPGGASRSYGIEAARLAGVPAPVLQRARQVLGRIEADATLA